MTESGPELNTEPLSMWAWLKAHPPIDGHSASSHDSSPVRIRMVTRKQLMARLDDEHRASPMRAHARIDDTGNVLVDFGGGSFELRFVFSPAEWGESTVKLGSNIRVPIEHKRALVDALAEQLTSPSPADEPPRDPPWLMSTEISRTALGFLASTLVLATEAPRAKLWMHLHFDPEGEGRLWLRGPRGKASRANLARALGEVL